MPYQKNEKSGFRVFSSQDEYSRSGGEGRNGVSRLIGIFLLLVLCIFAGYYAYQHYPVTEEDEPEAYRFEDEISSDSVFFSLHPISPDFIPYNKTKYDYFIDFSIQGSAYGMKFGTENGDLSQLALELQQLSDFGYCARACKEYGAMYKTDFVYDVLRMTLATDENKPKATPYEVTYLLHIMRRDPHMRNDSRLIAADLTNAMNSACLDSIEQRLQRELLAKNAIVVWECHSSISVIQNNKPSCLLQALAESPALWHASEDQLARAKACALLIVDRISEGARLHHKTEKDIEGFRHIAYEEIEAAFSPTPHHIDFSNTQQAFTTHIAPSH